MFITLRTAGRISLSGSYTTSPLAYEGGPPRFTRRPEPFLHQWLLNFVISINTEFLLNFAHIFNYLQTYTEHSTNDKMYMKSISHKITYLYLGPTSSSLAKACTNCKYT